MALPRTARLIGLRFETGEAFLQFLEIYRNLYPKGYVGLPGDNIAAVTLDVVESIAQALAAKGINYTETPIGSISALPSEEQALLRRSRGFRGTKKDRKKRLTDLRKKRRAR